MSTRKRSDDDFDREIRAHIEIETERLIEDGMTPDEARVAARRRFGNVTGVRERFYEAGRLLWLDHLVQDLRCAARNMRRYPVASLVAVLSLAAGIGATTVTLTIRDVIFRKPPPLYQHPEQLSKIQIGSPASPIMPVGNAVPVALYQSWRETTRTIDRGVHVARHSRRSGRRPHRQRPAAGGHAGALQRPRRRAITRRLLLRLARRRQRPAARHPQPSRVAGALRPAR